MSCVNLMAIVLLVNVNLNNVVWSSVMAMVIASGSVGHLAKIVRHVPVLTGCIPLPYVQGTVRVPKN